MLAGGTLHRCFLQAVTTRIFPMMGKEDCKMARMRFLASQALRGSSNIGHPLERRYPWVESSVGDCCAARGWGGGSGGRLSRANSFCAPMESHCTVQWNNNAPMDLHWAIIVSNETTMAFHRAVWGGLCGTMGGAWGANTGLGVEPSSHRGARGGLLGATGRRRASLGGWRTPGAGGFSAERPWGSSARRGPCLPRP